jgi:hypothetical protein
MNGDLSSKPQAHGTKTGLWTASLHTENKSGQREKKFLRKATLKGKPQLVENPIGKGRNLAASLAPAHES